MTSESPSFVENRLLQLLADAVGPNPNLSKLERELEEASTELVGEGEKATRIERRRLQRLLEGDATASFSFNEICLLNDYFRAKRVGDLAHDPIIKRPDLLQTFARSSRLVFVVATRKRAKQQRSDVADLDVLAMAELLGGVSRFDHHARLAFRSVPSVNNAKAALQMVHDNCADLFDQTNICLVGLGTPRANHAAELMLSQMFEVEPFKKQALGDLPFQFVWPPKDMPYVQGAFHLGADDLVKLDQPCHREVNAGTRALVLTDVDRRHTPFLCKSLGGGLSQDMGVVCCQRRPSGRIWACLAGLTGAGTLAAAMAVDRIQAALPQPMLPGQPSQVLWAAVRADTMNPESTFEATQRVMAAQVVAGPFVWTPPSQR